MLAVPPAVGCREAVGEGSGGRGEAVYTFASKSYGVVVIVVVVMCCSNLLHIQLLIAGCSAARMQQLCTTAPSELAPEPAVYTYARCCLYFKARLHNNNVFLTVV